MGGTDHWRVLGGAVALPLAKVTVMTLAGVTYPSRIRAETPSACSPSAKSAVERVNWCGDWKSVSSCRPSRDHSVLATPGLVPTVTLTVAVTTVSPTMVLPLDGWVTQTSTV